MVGTPHGGHSAFCCEQVNIWHCYIISFQLCGIQFMRAWIYYGRATPKDVIQCDTCGRMWLAACRTNWIPFGADFPIQLLVLKRYDFLGNTSILLYTFSVMLRTLQAFGIQCTFQLLDTLCGKCSIRFWEGANCHWSCLYSFGEQMKTSQTYSCGSESNLCVGILECALRIKLYLCVHSTTLYSTEFTEYRICGIELFTILTDKTLNNKTGL